jgi:hypothetical protein
MDEIIIDRELTAPARKIYSINAIWIGTFLGGPLSAGYLIAENFKALGQMNKVGPTWMIAIAFTAIIFGTIFWIPAIEEIPQQIIPLTYTAIAYALAARFQGERIKRFTLESGKVFSMWRAVGISLLWCVITFAPFFLLLLLTDPAVTAQ